MDGWRDGGMDGWIDGWMDGWMDGGSEYEYFNEWMDIYVGDALDMQ